ncbi:MAG: dynamin family protein [bacterium]
MRAETKGNKMKCSEMKTLYKKFKELEKEYQESLNKQIEMEKQIVKELDTNINHIENEIKKSVKTAEAVQNIKSLITLSASHIDNEIKSWKEQIKNANTSAEFSQLKQFEETFLIMMFGQVNTGKSFLMNLIAGKKAGSAKHIVTKPNFFSKEFSDISEHIDNPNDLYVSGFKEGAVETTSSIQGFVMDRLAFIDSPGIHSLNKANGALTKKYLGAADIVLFITNSHEPMNKSERDEVVKLIKTGSAPIIVCTRSDEHEKPMSKKEREEVENWCTSFIKEGLPKEKQSEKIRVFHVSSLLADIALQNNDDELFASSGMAALIEFIIQTIATSGVELKIKGPEKRMRTIANKISDNIGKTKNEIKSMRSGIEESLFELKQLLKDEATFIISDISGKIPLIIDKHAATKNVAEVEKELKTLLTNSAIDRFSEVVYANISQFNKNVMNVSESLTDSVQFSNITRQYVEREVGGRVAGSLGGAAVGGLIGFFLGGPLGAVIGASIGAGVGGMVGGMGDRSRTETIVVGDNREQVAAELIRKCSTILNEFPDKIADSIEKTYYRLLLDYLSGMDEKLNNIEKIVGGSRD